MTDRNEMNENNELNEQELEQAAGGVSTYDHIHGFIDYRCTECNARQIVKFENGVKITVPRCSKCGGRMVRA